ncbi:deacylase [Flavobacterium akiainvivens]|uniref:Deacylase n=1 Tax=Flavobacterium akiainvivens TaxID=1202724 RepID=A0A0M9VI64_9FLAO|nr:acyloxyacyl hydrolase [Flavobacterium akiainvivens]KOS06326.1 deacylase [Flavobacterium akiainvivens]SFQ16191.1 Lipid A 3-O-deacylase (PagL) [Flavobacterium akiainvivens]
MRLKLLLFLIFPFIALAQEAQSGYAVEANYFYGNIIPHRKSIQHLITGHPDGVILAFNRKTFGNHSWEQAFNYPDYGASFHYQDMKEASLGEMFGLYAHYNFYFFDRALMLRLGQGVAYNTNPYDKETNFRNYAYGVHLMPSTYFMLNLNRPDIWKGFGLQAGLVFIHHSNASIKAPNTSTNTFAVNVGLTYSLGQKQEYKPYVADTVNYRQPMHYNFIFRGGLNQSDVIGTKRYPYYAMGAYADKRLSRMSGVQLGAEFFWPLYLKEYIHYKSIAYPEENVDSNTDYRKVGVFGGYELYINRMSLEGQVGYYVYAPFNSTGKLYQRVGAKYYWANGVYSTLGLKTHGAKAEVMELGMGIRL